MSADRRTGTSPSERGWSPPSDTLRRDSSQESVLQANFERAIVRPQLERPDDAAGVALKQPLAALRAWSARERAPGWWHWSR